MGLETTTQESDYIPVVDLRLDDEFIDEILDFLLSDLPRPFNKFNIGTWGSRIQPKSQTTF